MSTQIKYLQFYQGKNKVKPKHNSVCLLFLLFHLFQEKKIITCIRLFYAAGKDIPKTGVGGGKEV